MTEVDSEEETFFFFAFIGKNLKKNDLKRLPQSLYLNPDHILSHMAWRNPLPASETKWKSLPWINKLIKDLIMQWFLAVFFPSELGDFVWHRQNHNIQLNGSNLVLHACQTNISRLCSLIYLPHIFSKAHRNKKKILISRYIFNCLYWWTTEFHIEVHRLNHAVVKGYLWLLSTIGVIRNVLTLDKPSL